MKSSQPVFGCYSKYYETIYSDKEYIEEANFLYYLLSLWSNNPNDILEFGSGTSKLSIILASKFDKITCVDSSETMIDIAKKNLSKVGKDISSKIKLQNCDIANLNLEKKFDLLISFFHVVCYFNSNEELKTFFEKASSHLSKNSLFIFDYWYGPAVLHQKPSNRNKVIPTNSGLIKRSCISDLNDNNSTVSVKYKINFVDSNDNLIEEIYETHNMRYLFLNEINMYADLYGFEVLRHGSWFKNTPPNIDDWNAYSILRKR